MRATPPARALAWFVEFLGRFWGLVALAIGLGLDMFVFGPRGMKGWMIGGRRP